MAYIQTDVKLPEINHVIKTALYFPTDLPASVGNKVQGVITLLNGYGGSGSDWMMMTAAVRYAADNGYILIAPDADNSFYQNMANGKPYYDIFTHYLPTALQQMFVLPQEREKNYLCGLSMGGYGALLIGMRNPEKYAAVGSFSGAVDMGSIVQTGGANVVLAADLTAAFGTQPTLSAENDLFVLARKLSALPAQQQPKLYLSCGTQDMLLTMNRALAQAMKENNLPVVYNEWAGVHEWNFWDRSLAKFIGYFQNSNYGLRKETDWSTPCK